MKYASMNICKTCHRPYWFLSGGGGMHQDHENYDCPYCGEHEGQEKTGGVPQTIKFKPEEEAEWRAKQ